MSNICKYMSIKDLIKFLLLFLLVNIILGLICIPIGNILGMEMTVLSKIMYVPIFVLLILYLRRARKKGFSISGDVAPKLKFRGLRMYYVLMGYIVIFALGVVMEPVDRLIPNIELEKYYTLFSSGNVILNMLIGVLFAPIFEEIVFRGYIQQDLSVKYGRVYSILITSLVFGIIHFSLVQSFNAFLIAIILGFIFYLSGKSLMTVIIIHLINNMFSMITMYAGIAGEDRLLTLSDLLNNDTYIAIIRFSCHVIILLTIVWFSICAYRWRRNTIDKSL